jgi:hypothetical protein
MKGRRFRVVLAVFTVLGLLALVAPAPVALAQGAWYGEYFANPNLSGGPAFTRYDNNLRFDWGGGSPGGGIPADNFSVRWTRDQWFEAGSHRFSYRSDDGIRIWIDGTLVVDDWRDRQAVWSSVDRYVSRGTHTVRVEYYERTGGARVEVAWERISGGAVWRAEYFDNRKLSGSPVLVRYDAAVDFAWKEDSPHAKVPADDFSVRWTRTLGFTAGTYRFYASCDDGVRITVDGSRVVDAWRDQKLPNTRTGDITLGEGQHTVVVEYYDHGGEASAHVWWNRLGTFAGWEGRYYDNADLRGGPALVRDDAEINFDWGDGAPADWMPDDNFSAIWTRSVTFSPGYYRFNVMSDDGVRVWLDDGLVMDYWKPMEYEYHTVDGIYLEGTHRFKVAYFERTGLARIQFWWKPAGTAPAPAVPTPVSTPTPVPAPVTTRLGPWQGEYFNNGQLSGTPAVVRTDAALDFDWGWSAPAVGVNRDNFSARWTGTFSFEGGRYRFTTNSDDGVRVIVDGQRVIDAWTPMRGTRTGEITLSGGNHTVQVEYFERLQAAMVRLGVQRLGDGAAAPTTPAPTTPARPVVCEGGPLRLDAWYTDRACTATGWKATVYVRGHGGDCTYTYAWDGEVKGSPTSGPMMFELRTRGGAMVGTASVSSAGQTAKVPLYIPRPTCD